MLSILSPAAWLGPIFQKEVRTAGRRKGTYLVRSLYALGLALIAGVGFYAFRTEAEGSVVLQMQSMQSLAPHLSGVIAWFQFVGLFFAAPVLASGSICDERRARSLDVLMTTPMTAGHIVVGKLTSRIVQIVILALLAMPVLLAVRVFGGLNAEAVLATSCVSISTAVLGAALAIMFSMRQKRATMAALFAILTLVLLQCGPSLVEGIRYELTNQYATVDSPFRYNIIATCGPGALEESVAAVTSGEPLPHVVLFDPKGNSVGSGALRPQQATRPGAPPTRAAVDLGPMWLINTGYNLILSLGVTLFTTVGLRRAMKQSEGRERLLHGSPALRAKKAGESEPVSEVAEASPGEAVSVSPVVSAQPQTAEEGEERYRSRDRIVSDNPVLWREIRQPTFGSRVIFKIAAALVVVTMGWLYWQVGVSSYGLHLSLAIVGAAAVMFQAVFLTSGPYAGEREARTWDVLLTSTLGGGEILLGKLVGTLRGFWFIPTVVWLDFAIAAAAGYVRPAALIMLPLIYAGPILFFTCTGQLLSLRFKRAVTAGALNLGIAFVMWGLIWFIIVLTPAILGGVLAAPKVMRIMNPDAFIDNLMDNHLETALDGALAMNPIAAVVKVIEPCLFETAARGGIARPPFEAGLITNKLNLPQAVKVVVAVFGGYCLLGAIFLGMARLRFRAWSGRSS